MGRGVWASAYGAGPHGQGRVGIGAWAGACGHRRMGRGMWASAHGASAHGASAHGQWHVGMLSGVKVHVHGSDGKGIW
eukprot:354218-Chlamydomonas_euryale.AAC.3